MRIGLFEIAFMAISWGFVASLHLAVFLITRRNNQKLPRMLLLLYGIPACQTIACLLTPPDLISSLTVAAPCIILYIIISACALLLARHLSKRKREHPA